MRPSFSLSPFVLQFKLLCWQLGLMLLLFYSLTVYWVVQTWLCSGLNADNEVRFVRNGNWYFHRKFSFVLCRSFKSWFRENRKLFSHLSIQSTASENSLGCKYVDVCALVIVAASSFVFLNHINTCWLSMQLVGIFHVLHVKGNCLFCARQSTQLCVKR